MKSTKQIITFTLLTAVVVLGGFQVYAGNSSQADADVQEQQCSPSDCAKLCPDMNCTPQDCPPGACSPQACQPSDCSSGKVVDCSKSTTCNK